MKGILNATSHSRHQCSSPVRHIRQPVSSIDSFTTPCRRTRCPAHYHARSPAVRRRSFSCVRSSCSRLVGQLNARVQRARCSWNTVVL